MLAVIMLNLASIIVVVGGWALTVWTFYRRLGSPYAAYEARRLPGTSSLPGADRLRKDALHEKRAA